MEYSCLRPTARVPHEPCLVRRRTLAARLPCWLLRTIAHCATSEARGKRSLKGIDINVAVIPGGIRPRTIGRHEQFAVSNKRGAELAKAKAIVGYHVAIPEEL